MQSAHACACFVEVPVFVKIGSGMQPETELMPFGRHFGDLGAHCRGLGASWDLDVIRI